MMRTTAIPFPKYLSFQDACKYLEMTEDGVRYLIAEEALKPCVFVHEPLTVPEWRRLDGSTELVPHGSRLAPLGSYTSKQVMRKPPGPLFLQMPTRLGAHQCKFRVASSKEWARRPQEERVIPEGDGDCWYYLPDPLDMPAIEQNAAFLRSSLDAIGANEPVARADMGNVERDNLLTIIGALAQIARGKIEGSRDISTQDDLLALVEATYKGEVRSLSVDNLKKRFAEANKLLKLRTSDRTPDE